MKREEKQTARYFCTISQWPRQLWGACVWVLVYWCVCVCVCTSRAQTDYRLSRRRRRLAASEAACRELLTPHRKCACQPVCVCVCSAFCFIWIFVAKQSADSNREWVKETVPKLRQLLGALQPEVDFRVEFFAPFHCFHCNWSGLVYWVSSWNRAKPKPIADDHTRPLSWPDIDSLSALHPILHFSPISPPFLPHFFFYNFCFTFLVIQCLIALRRNELISTMTKNNLDTKVNYYTVVVVNRSCVRINRSILI